MESYLCPVMATKPPAPDILLNMISCGCKTGCRVSCGCRKIGMKCSPMCNFCLGQTCTNIPRELNVSEGSEEFGESAVVDEGDVQILSQRITKKIYFN